MAYVLHRTPCCRSQWESRHNKKDLLIGIPNNVIKYTASEKLPEISSGYNGGGIDTRMFDVSIVNHTFKNGIGTIEFDGDITIIKDGSSGPPMGAFYNCSSLTSITIPNSITSIGTGTFWNCTSLPSITIPNSVTNIRTNAFSNCKGLTSVTIPNSVTSIGDSAFSNCGNLTSVIIPNSVTSIGIATFSNCSKLTSITIPNSVTSVSSSTFSSCNGLTEIIVESGNTVYDSRNNCNALIETASNKLIVGCKNTFIPNSVTSIGNGAFSNCGLTSVIIPSSVVSIGQLAFSSCNNLTSIEVDSENALFDSRNNCNAIIETNTNTLIAGCKNTIIPNSVTIVGANAFYGCGLTSIIIPDSVTIIGQQTFYNCNELNSVTIGNSVTNIGNMAFSSCSELTSITLLATTAPTIKSNTFQNIKTDGTLIVPSGSTGYDVWMGTGNYYLGKYNWTKVEQ